MGVELNSLDAGCCGMAGPFGFEKDKYAVSQAIGERRLLPAVRQADPETITLSRLTRLSHPRILHGQGGLSRCVNKVRTPRGAKPIGLASVNPPRVHLMRQQIDRHYALRRKRPSRRR